MISHSQLQNDAKEPPAGVQRPRLSWVDDAATTITVTCEAPKSSRPHVIYEAVPQGGEQPARTNPGRPATGAGPSASVESRQQDARPAGAAPAGATGAAHSSVAMSQTTALSSGPAVWTATICNLTPDTAYRYRITLTEPTPDGHRDRPDEDDGWRQFRTARTEGGTVRAGWLADTGLAGRPDGNATGTERIYKELIHADCTVVLGGGDYAYANADGRYDSVEDAIDEWFRQAEDLIGSVPFMPQYGNHEIYLEERFEDWAPRFVLPLGSRDGRCYAFTVGCVRFVSFFAPGRNPADAHIAWLQEDLESPERQRCRWCVVYHHEAMYGHGYSHPTNLNIRNLLAPVYEAAAVDLVVNAHDQNYERTYPLVQIPHIAALGSVDLSSYRQGEGVIFLKSSPGGKRSEIGNRFSPFTAPQDRAIAVRDATGHHYSILEATPEMLTVRSFLVPEDAATRELETFSIHAVEA